MLREALAPFVRELRQTLASFRASAKLEVEALLVMGGGGRLRGLLPFLEAELGVPARFPRCVRCWRAADATSSAIPPASRRPRPSPTSYALAAAIALAASRGSTRDRLPPRAASSTARASRSCARRRPHLAGLALSLLLAGASTSARSSSSLGSERKELDKQLTAATQELFGKPRDDAEAVTELLRKGFREELAPLPKATAFDLLDQISRKVPPADKVKLDVAELDIRPKKTFIKGTVDSAAAVDEIAGKLKEIECFEEVTKGAITEVSGGAQAVHPHHHLQVPVTGRPIMSALSDMSRRSVSGGCSSARSAYFASGVGAAGAAREARSSPPWRRWLAISTIIYGTWSSFSSISDLEDGNAAIREALAAIAKHRDEYLEAKARSAVQEARIGDAPPQLAGDLEAAAHDENIQIAESSERPTARPGGRYVEHDIDLKIREVDLQA